MNNVKRFEDSKKQQEAEYERQVLLQHLKSKEKEQLEINRLNYLITKTDFYKKIMEKLEK
jgi:hypothetical protein